MNQGICCNPAYRQRGDALIEALFGLLLMAVISLGLSYAASRAVLSQRYLNTQNIVISQMRESLVTAGSASSLCDAGSGPTIQVAGGSTALNINCEHESVTVATISDVTASTNGNSKGSPCPTTPPPVLTATLTDSVLTSLTLSTPPENDAAKALIGGDGRIEVSL